MHGSIQSAERCVEDSRRSGRGVMFYSKMEGCCLASGAGRGPAGAGPGGAQPAGAGIERGSRKGLPHRGAACVCVCGRGGGGWRIGGVASHRLVCTLDWIKICHASMFAGVVIRADGISVSRAQPPPASARCTGNDLHFIMHKHGKSRGHKILYTWPHASRSRSNHAFAHSAASNGSVDSSCGRKPGALTAKRPSSASRRAPATWLGSTGG